MTQSKLLAASVCALALAAILPGSALALKDLRTFQSPSHNIGCAMVKGELGHGVRCDARHHSWQAPPKPHSCDLDWGSGLVVGRHGEARYVCAGDTVLGQGPVLDYGKAIQFGGFRCKSKRSGVRCANRANGHGFKLSRETAKRF